MQQTHPLEAIQKIASERIKRVKVESDVDHAILKATKEVVNKTMGDEAHTFVITEHLDDFTIVLWAQNSNNKFGKTIYSRTYAIVAPSAID